ncbi:MAG: DUF2232 domain-containing protein [Rhizobiales bacterium]|nr:DUF2232 domain-containing protein [Hyphomicrobiales bacterium]
MTGTLFIGLGAGLTSSLLYGSVFTGSSLAIILFYLAPLPLMLAGIGWGWRGAAVGAVAGAIADALLLNTDVGLFFTVTCAAPAVWLSYLAMLSRPVDESVEWYPPGRLVAWTACFAFVLAAIAMLAIGPDVETYRANVKAAVEELMSTQSGDPDSLGDAEQMSDYLARLLLPATVSAWMITMLANLWIAGRVLRTSSRLTRPWPDLHALELPRPFIIAVGLCIALSMLPGSAGLIGTAALSACIIAYMLVGLAILHMVTLNFAARRVLLTLVYFSLLAFIFAALIVAAIGIGEPYLRLRARARSNQSGST